MSVVALPNIEPRGGGGVEDQWSLTSLTAGFRGTLGSSLKTLERPGAWWSCNLNYHNLSGAEAARMQAFLSACRGQAQRFYAPDFTRVPRGSFPATELLTNNFFASGTTAWAAQSQITASVSDAIYRAQRNSMTSAVSVLSNSSAATVVQYAPYAARALMLAGRGAYTGVGVGVGSTQHAQDIAAASFSSSFRLATTVAVPLSTSAYISVIDNNTSGLMAGDYFSVAYVSLGRCALVDNAPNLLLRSDEFDNASWTKTNCTAGANAGTSPDGTVTAESLIETAASGVHSFSQAVTVSATALDYSFSCAIFGGSRGFVALQIGTAGGSAIVYVNTATGAISTAAAASGNFTDARAFVAPLGGGGAGWFQVSIVARKGGSETSLTATVLASNASGNISYAGTGSLVALYAWRATLAQASHPTKLSQTTTTATSGTSQTGGAMNLRGLPVSTSGLLLPGDPAEIITSIGSQYVRTVAPLNSDAAGLGHWQFEAPLRNSPSDNGAVIVLRPLCRMLLDSNSVGWSEHSGGFADLEFKAVEDVAA